MSDAPTLLFAGGGTGGHIVPNLAVVDRLLEMGVAFTPHFLVSSRAIDAKVMAGRDIAFTQLKAQPMAMQPAKFLTFAKNLVGGARADALRVMRATQAKAVVATGGFVSAPVVLAARQAGIPVALVSLDAVPGKANKLAAPFVTRHFSAYPVPGGKTEEVGPLLRRGVVSRKKPEDARLALGMDPHKPLLLVFGGSQGGGTVNQAMAELARRQQTRDALKGWQVLHLTGEADFAASQEAWAGCTKATGMVARVEPFLNGLSDAWAASSVALCRAGAGSVGEAWAAGVPCVFMPYPWHKDQHQKLNAVPLVRAGGAIVLTDLKETSANARQLEETLVPLLTRSDVVARMRRALFAHPPGDGALALAKWAAGYLQDGKELGDSQNL